MKIEKYGETEIWIIHNLISDDKTVVSCLSWELVQKAINKHILCLSQSLDRINKFNYSSENCRDHVFEKLKNGDDPHATYYHKLPNIFED
jgi:hypothetical protein